MKKDVYITDYNCVTPLGFDVENNWKALVSGQSGVQELYFENMQKSFFVAKIDDKILEEKFNKNFKNSVFSRLEKILILSLQPLIEQNKISEKTALIFSTTKGNISLIKGQNEIPENAYLGNSAQKIADFFDFKIKPVVISNACVSGVMAISVAKNMISAGICEDAFVLAGDEISEFVLSGFNSFQAISKAVCKPYDENRDGINLGEAAASCFITANPSGNENFSFKISGGSAINDANHISGPSRTGDGLFASVENAMKEANVSSGQIDFISAHGTATVYNDEMEAIAFNRANLQNIPLHSLKAFYGHTLGASGLLESIISMESAKRNLLIASKNFEKSGVSQFLNILKENQAAKINTILKTASGFGGCNAAIILEKIN
ncbi:beta-ketoacyl synthase [Chryseobacterium sp. Leaf180]|uniref:beta-ketoacyl synthase N-terminal-like domain-containing protein n=1 Tax=Chryseobacterium sp. Leaf180 TaxID=1736289 RepID=UPI0006F7F44E|nr:beta-ketoacyl synthase N-terminal-like domain-containing protein [Chryseobacterium sp. Leaf180]KQR94998.1 beta-ketoacyl synthase [Chryseobacterium sp. Leaf180]